MDHVVDHVHTPFKHTADYAFLAPHVTLAEFSVSDETCELGARAGAARRAVVGFAGTEHEIFTIDTGKLRRRKKFDVIDLVTAEAGDARVSQRRSHPQSEIHQSIEIFEHELFRMF